MKVAELVAKLERTVVCGPVLKAQFESIKDNPADFAEILFSKDEKGNTLCNLVETHLSNDEEFLKKFITKLLDYPEVFEKQHGLMSEKFIEKALDLVAKDLENFIKTTPPPPAVDKLPTPEVISSIQKRLAILITIANEYPQHADRVVEEITETKYFGFNALGLWDKKYQNSLIAEIVWRDIDSLFDELTKCEDVNVFKRLLASRVKSRQGNELAVIHYFSSYAPAYLDKTFTKVGANGQGLYELQFTSVGITDTPEWNTGKNSTLLHRAAVACPDRIPSILQGVGDQAKAISEVKAGEKQLTWYDLVVPTLAKRLIEAVEKYSSNSKPKPPKGLDERVNLIKLFVIILNERPDFAQETFVREVLAIVINIVKHSSKIQKNAENIFKFLSDIENKSIKHRIFTERAGKRALFHPTSYEREIEDFKTPLITILFSIDPDLKENSGFKGLLLASDDYQEIIKQKKLTAEELVAGFEEYINEYIFLDDCSALIKRIDAVVKADHVDFKVVAEKLTAHFCNDVNNETYKSLIKIVVDLLTNPQVDLSDKDIKGMHDLLPVLLNKEKAQKIDEDNGSAFFTEVITVLEERVNRHAQKSTSTLSFNKNSLNPNRPVNQCFAEMNKVMGIKEVRKEELQPKEKLQKEEKPQRKEAPVGRTSETGFALETASVSATDPGAAAYRLVIQKIKVNPSKKEKIEAWFVELVEAKQRTLSEKEIGNFISGRPWRSITQSSWTKPEEETAAKNTLTAFCKAENLDRFWQEVGRETTNTGFKQKLEAVLENKNGNAFEMTSGN